MASSSGPLGWEEEEEAQLDVGELLGLVGPSGAPRSGDAAMDADGTGEAGDPQQRLMERVDDDLPPPLDALPEDVKYQVAARGARFETRCALDLQELAMRTKAEYNPRRRHVLRFRFARPLAVSATVTDAGVVVIPPCKGDETALRQAARMIVKILQSAGYPQATLKAFEITNAVATADLRFPVRLASLAAKWARHSMYDPDVTSALQFYLAKPRCTFTVRHTGKMTIHGNLDETALHEALRRTYGIFRDFSR